MTDPMTPTSCTWTPADGMTVTAQQPCIDISLNGDTYGYSIEEAVQIAAALHAAVAFLEGKPTEGAER